VGHRPGAGSVAGVAQRDSRTFSFSGPNQRSREDGANCDYDTIYRLLRQLEAIVQSRKVNRDNVFRLVFALGVCWSCSFAWVLSDIQPLAAVAVYVLLPWVMVALVLAFPEDTTMSMDRRAGETAISVPFCWLMNIVMYVGPFLGSECVLNPAGLWFGVFPSAALFIASARVEKDWRRTRSKLLALALLLFFTLPYGYVAVRGLNTALDTSIPILYRSRVSGKRFGYRGGPRVTVEPWGPVKKTQDVLVTEDVYRGLQIGGPVCMALRQGALKVAWYGAEVCPGK
jgi:hypothetical protein